MSKTKLISPGIPNYTLKRNLRLNDKYISNDGGDEGIRVDDSGNVGIGTASLGAKLHVYGDGNLNGLIQGSSTTNYIQFQDSNTGLSGNTSNGTTVGTNTGAFHINNREDKNIQFATNDTTRMVIKNDGNVGIGTGAPVEKLQVNGSIKTTEHLKLLADSKYILFGADSEVQLLHNSNRGLTLHASSNASTGTKLNFLRERQGSGTPSTVGGTTSAGQDNDEIGELLFQGYNDAGTPEKIDYAKIVASINDASDTDESGKLTLYVAESDGSTSHLSQGLVLTGSSVTDGKVDVTLGNVATSITTIAGDLKVTGNSIISSTDVTCMTLSGDDVKMADSLIMDSDASHIFFGSDAEVYFNHVHNVGLELKLNNVAGTNDAKNILQIIRNTSDTAANNFTAGISYDLEGADGNLHTGVELHAILADASDGAEDFDFAINLMEGSSLSQKMRLTSAGNLSITGDMTVGDDILLTSDSSYVEFGANGEIRLSHQHDKGLILDSNTSLTNSAVDSLVIRHWTDGTPADGIGSNIKFACETADGMTSGMTLGTVATTVASGGEDFDFVVNLTEGDSLSEKMRLTHQGFLGLGTSAPSAHIHARSSVSTAPIFLLENNVNDAEGAHFWFKKDKGAAGADGDDIGIILFQADNSAQELTYFAKIVGEISEATDGDEAGKLSFYVAESNGSSSQLTAGLVIEGEHATDGEIDVTIAAGSASMTTVSGNLTVTGDIDIDGNDITSPSSLTISPGNHLTVDAPGDIILDSGSGDFVVKNAGTEFSVANSSYAGMILGYTSLGADANATYYAVTNAYEVISDTHKITFVAPPSGKVEIETSCYMDVISASAARALYLSLSSANATTGYAAVDVQHEHIVAHADETDSTGIINKWVVEGLTAGTSYTYWIGTKSTHSSNLRLYWGGDSTSEYAPFIVKATALPATIYDGS